MYYAAAYFIEFNSINKLQTLSMIVIDFYRPFLMSNVVYMYCCLLLMLFVLLLLLLPSPIDHFTFCKANVSNTLLKTSIKGILSLPYIVLFIVV